MFAATEIKFEFKSKDILACVEIKNKFVELAVYLNLKCIFIHA